MSLFQYICENHFQRLSKRSMFTGLKAINHFGRPDMTSFLKFVQKTHNYVSLPSGCQIFSVAVTLLCYLPAGSDHFSFLYQRVFGVCESRVLSFCYGLIIFILFFVILTNRFFSVSQWIISEGLWFCSCFPKVIASHRSIFLNTTHGHRFSSLNIILGLLV